jgi:hypothetical protein
MVSNEELEKALMIENPMPDKAVWLAETEEQDELERQANIAILKEELAKLEGENKGE